MEHVRYWKPTPEILTQLHHGHLLHTSASVSDATLLSIIRKNASSTFLIVTRNAALRINSMVLPYLFPANLYVGTLKMDDEQPPTEIYKGMRIIFTQNRDKQNGVVNGQPGVIMMMSNCSVFVRLPNGKVVAVHPVSVRITKSQDDDVQECHIRTTYPFIPGYAITICKSQGQTLGNVVMWFDTETLGQGAAYVALSRVKSFQNIKFLTLLHPAHFNPVTR